MLFGWLYAYFAWIYHRMFKWVIRALTGRHELQRICVGGRAGNQRTSSVEKSLKNSKLIALRRVLEEDDINVSNALQGIIAIKGIDTLLYPEFVPFFRDCLEEIRGYKCLLPVVEAIRIQPYQTTRQDHEDLLLKLWSLLMPDTPLESRISKQWGIVGFQGDDPATDFRGMGMLGLLNLIYFAEEHNEAARHVLSHSHHPKLGYSYAIVGINMTSLVYHLLKDGSLKTHMYNHVRGRPSVEDFHQLYCHTFFNFDKFWMAEKPRDIMEFSRLRDKYEDRLRSELRKPATVLKCNFDLAD